MFDFNLFYFIFQKNKIKLIIQKIKKKNVNVDLMKFFAFELGVPVRESNLKGHHDQIKLSKLVDSFIEKFVICKSCSNPETDIVFFFFELFFLNYFF